MNRPVQLARIDDLKRKLDSIGCESCLHDGQKTVLRDLRQALDELQQARQGDDHSLVRSEAEAGALLEASEMYQILAEETLVGVYIIQDEIFVYVNDPFALIFGRPRDEIVGSEVLDLVAPEDRAMVRNNLRARVKGQTRSLRYRARCLHRDGSILDIEIYGTRTSFRGRPAVIGTLLDRTEEENTLQALKRSETEYRVLMEQAQESEQRWRSLVENPFDFVVIVDRNGIFQYINHTDFGLHMDDLIGKQTMFEFVVPEQREQVREALGRVFKTGRPTYYESFSPEPVNRWYGNVVGPIERNSEIVAASILTRDISQQKEAEIALRASEERFRQLAENIQDVFYVYDPEEHRILYVSPGYDKIWGRPHEELYADPDAPNRSVHPEDLQRVLEEFRKPLEDAAGGHALEYRIQRPDGELRWLRHRRFGIQEDQHIGRVVGVVTDITEQINAGLKLRDAEAKYRMLIEKLPIITYISALDSKMSTLYVSPQIESTLGFTQEEWTTDPALWSRQVHPDDRDQWRRELTEFHRTGEPLRIDYRLLSAEGETHWFRDEAVLVRGKSGEPDLIQGLMLDVTEVEEAHVGRQRALRLSSSLVEIQETERRKLARELHDEIGQVLTGLKLLLQLQSGSGSNHHLDEASQVVNELLTNVRELSLELRPAMLDDLGLLAAYFWLFERCSKRMAIEVRFEHRGLDLRFDPTLETAAYRFVQEALTNVARHAGISEVHVRAWTDSATLNVQVEDRGAGFDVERVLQDHSHTGLLGMQERMTLLGGHLEIESSRGRGARLTAHFPLQIRESESSAERGEGA